MRALPLLAALALAAPAFARDQPRMRCAACSLLPVGATGSDLTLTGVLKLNGYVNNSYICGDAACTKILAYRSDSGLWIITGANVDISGLSVSSTAPTITGGSATAKFAITSGISAANANATTAPAFEFAPMNALDNTDFVFAVRNSALTNLFAVEQQGRFQVGSSIGLNSNGYLLEEGGVNIGFDSNGIIALAGSRRAYLRNNIDVDTAGTVGAGVISQEADPGDTAVRLGTIDANPGVGVGVVQVCKGASVTACTELAVINEQGYYSKAASHDVLGRDMGCWVTGGNTAATTFTAKGLAAAPAAPTGTASAQVALGTKMYIQYAGAASANAVAGLNGGAFTQTRPFMRPKGTFAFRTDSAITSRRIWAAVTESTLATVAIATGPTASAVDFVAIGYEDAVNSNKFMCCSGDGTNYSCSDTGATAVAVSTEYVLSVDFSTSGTLRCCVSASGAVPTCVNKTSNVSSTATDLGLYLANTTTNSAAQNMQIHNACLEQN